MELWKILIERIWKKFEIVSERFVEILIIVLKNSNIFHKFFNKITQK